MTLQTPIEHADALAIERCLLEVVHTDSIKYSDVLTALIQLEFEREHRDPIISKDDTVITLEYIDRLSQLPIFTPDKIEGLRKEVLQQQKLAILRESNSKPLYTSRLASPQQQVHVQNRGINISRGTFLRWSAAVSLLGTFFGGGYYLWEDNFSPWAKNEHAQRVINDKLKFEETRMLGTQQSITSTSNWYMRYPKYDKNITYEPISDPEGTYLKSGDPDIKNSIGIPTFTNNLFGRQMYHGLGMYLRDHVISGTDKHVPVIRVENRIEDKVEEWLLSPEDRSDEGIDTRVVEFRNEMTNETYYLSFEFIQGATPTYRIKLMEQIK